MQVSLAWLGRDPAPTLLYKSMALHEESRHSLPGHRRINLFCFNWSTQPLTSVANHTWWQRYFGLAPPPRIPLLCRCFSRRHGRGDTNNTQSPLTRLPNGLRVPPLVSKKNRPIRSISARRQSVRITPGRGAGGLAGCIRR